MKHLLVIFFILFTPYSYANCDLPSNYKDLCNYKLSPVPKYVIDTKGIGVGSVVAIFNTSNNETIKTYIEETQARFPMQALLNLAFQNNSDAMTYLAMSFNNSDWKQYWLKKAYKNNNFLALNILRGIEYKEKRPKGESRKIFKEKYRKLKFKLANTILSDKTFSQILKDKLKVNLIPDFKRAKSTSYQQYFSTNAIKTLEQLALEGNNFAIDKINRDFAYSKSSKTRHKYRDLYEIKSIYGDSHWNFNYLANCYSGYNEHYCVNIKTNHQKAYDYTYKYAKKYSQILDALSKGDGYIIHKTSLQQKKLTWIAEKYIKDKKYDFAEAYLKKAFDLREYKANANLGFYGFSELDKKIYNSLLAIYDPIINLSPKHSSYNNLFKFTSSIGSSEFGVYNGLNTRTALIEKIINKEIQEVGILSSLNLNKIKVNNHWKKQYYKSLVGFLNDNYKTCYKTVAKGSNYAMSKCVVPPADLGKAFQALFRYISFVLHTTEKDRKFYDKNFSVPTNLANLDFDRTILLQNKVVVKTLKDKKADEEIIKQRKCDNSSKETLLYEKSHYKNFFWSCKKLSNLMHNSKYFESAKSHGSIYSLAMRKILQPSEHHLAYYLPIELGILTRSKKMSLLTGLNQDGWKDVVYTKYNLSH